MYEVVVRSNFSAAHRLMGYKGKCESLHGHNWIVEVAVSSKEINRNGILIDFRALKDRLAGVLEKLDHTCLNELPEFQKENPTSENIAKYIFDMLNENEIAARYVRVWESDTSCVTYYRE